jgi:hypothetical protein
MTSLQPETFARLYYEVHGKGQPIVLAHGPFMNIPMNWGHLIPPSARARQVIVAEMQGHGRLGGCAAPPWDYSARTPRSSH